MKQKLSKYSRLLGNVAPYAGLIIITLFFQIATSGELLQPENLQSLINQILITALAAIGGVFVFGMGEFDASLGSLVGLSAVLATMAGIRTGSMALIFVICMVIPLVMGLIKGIFASYVEVPFFIFTVVLGSVISALVLVIMGKETTIYLRNAVTEIRTFSFNEMTAISCIMLAAYLGLCIFVFNYTGFGIKVKMLGGNKKATKQSGINITRTKIVSFLMSAIGIGLAAFIIVIRVRTVGYSTASTTGNDVMIALVLGGMPLSGGPRTKISAGIVGAATITILNYSLAMMGASTGVIQALRAVIFMIVVFASSMSYRTKLLPR